MQARLWKEIDPGNVSTIMLYLLYQDFLTNFFIANFFDRESFLILHSTYTYESKMLRKWFSAFRILFFAKEISREFLVCISSNDIWSIQKCIMKMFGICIFNKMLAFLEISGDYHENICYWQFQKMVSA